MWMTELHLRINQPNSYFLTPFCVTVHLFWNNACLQLSEIPTFAYDPINLAGIPLVTNGNCLILDRSYMIFSEFKQVLWCFPLNSHGYHKLLSVCYLILALDYTPSAVSAWFIHPRSPHMHVALVIRKWVSIGITWIFVVLDPAWYSTPPPNGSSFVHHR